MLYRFEDFELDEERFELRRGETAIDIEPQSLRLLLRLVEAQGAVVDRDALFRDVLGVEYASDDALFKAVQRARRAVGDDGRSQRLVKTVAGRGYRFVGELNESATSETAAAKVIAATGATGATGARDPERPLPVSAAPAPPHAARWATLAAALLLVGVLAVGWWSADRGVGGVSVLGLDLETMSPEDIEEVWRDLPASAQAATTVVGAMQDLRDGDPLAARDRLLPALADAPDDPFVLAALARTYRELGDLDRAARTARDAVQAAQRLPASRRLDLDALLLETRGELDAAAARYDALLALAPERPRYALAALRCRVESGRADLGEEFVEVEARLALHDLAESTELERLWLEARLHGNASDLVAQLEAAETLEQLANRRGKTGYVGRARWLRGDALQKLGELDAALALAFEGRGLDGLPDAAPRGSLVRARDHAYRGRGEEARELLDELRSRFHDGELEPNLPLQLAVEADAARLALLRRDLPEAEALGSTALEMSRRLGHRGRLASLLRQQADVLTDAGRFDDAEALYVEALALHRQSGDPGGEAGVLLGLGLLQRLLGEPYQAADRLDEAAALYASIGRRDRQSVVLYNVASVNVSLCRLDAARDALEESRRIEEEARQTAGVAWALHGLALVSFEQGDLARAGDEIREALALRRELGDISGIVVSEVRQALILDRSDRSVEALALLDGLLAGALEEPSEMRNLALNLRSYALIHLGRLDDAAANVAISRQANAEIGVAFSDTLTDLVAADLAIQQAEFEEALELAARARDQAERLHDQAALIEARRLLLEAEHRLEMRPAATRVEQARALVDDARRLGCSARLREAEAWLERVGGGA